MSASTTQERQLSLSAMLLSLADMAQGPVSVAHIVEYFGPRAFGAVLFVFAIPNVFPLPPGSTTVLGMPLLIIAPQLAFGRRRLWIPDRLGRLSIDGGVLASICRRAAPWVARGERLTTRRLGFMFGAVGDAGIGIICSLLAAVLILPIPLGNMVPALAIATLAFSLVQRDGLLALAGYGLALASVALLVLSGGLVVQAVSRLGAMLGLWWGHRAGAIRLRPLWARPPDRSQAPEGLSPPLSPGRS